MIRYLPLVALWLALAIPAALAVDDGLNGYNQTDPSSWSPQTAGLLP